jgi:hypothetical protein
MSTIDVLTQDGPRQQAARLGPFSSDHLEFLMEDFAAWMSDEGPTFFVLSDRWADPPCPDLPLMIDFLALELDGIPRDQWEEKVRRDPLSVTFVVQPDGDPYPAARFRWPSDTESTLDWVHGERLRLYPPSAKAVYLEGDEGWRSLPPHPDNFWPLLPFPFYTHVMDNADDGIAPSIGVNQLVGASVPLTDPRLEWCCEILRTFERHGFVVWWFWWKSPRVGMSHAEHSEYCRNGFKRMDTKPSERCQFSNDPGGEITNARQDPTNPKVSYPLQLKEILHTLDKRFAEWPRRIDNLLFVLDQAGQPRYLPKTDALFSWVQLFGKANWFEARGYVSQSQFFEAIRASAKQYAAIEALPHEPPFADRFYLKPAPEPGDGSALRALLNRFTPETEHDRQLIAALFATVIWGESGGQRPAFLLTADGGRGSGKTTLAKMVAAFAGGKFDVSPTEDEGRIKNRLLTPESLTTRVALIDNLKSMKFSWDFLEGLITSDSISGHRLYCGNGSRPNNLIWILTVNGASLSTDMSQRVITIKLDRPKRSGAWEEETSQFIRENRQLIIADLIGLLRREKQPLAQHSRWARWEDEVLSRLEEPDELQRLIVTRQQGTDAEADEAQAIEEHFETCLKELTLDTDTGRYFIPGKYVYRWFCDATAERNLTPTGVSRRLKQSINEGRIRRLEYHRHKKHGRGFQWNGENASTKEPDHESVAHEIEKLKIIAEQERIKQRRGY